MEQLISVKPEGDKPKMALRVIQDSTGNIWLLNDLFLYKYDAVNKKVVTWMKLPASNPTMTSGVIAFSKEASVIWIHNGTTLYKISLPRRQILTAERMPRQAANLWADSNYLWLSFWTQYLCR
jgi:hypothetical protein